VKHPSHCSFLHDVSDQGRACSDFSADKNRTQAWRAYRSNSYRVSLGRAGLASNKWTAGGSPRRAGGSLQIASVGWPPISGQNVQKLNAVPRPVLFKSAEGNYARPKAISTEGRGAAGASWTISSALANTRQTPVASVIFRLSGRSDGTFCGAASLEHAKINAPTLPPAHTKLSLSQLAAMPSPTECR
jgi:hypothetical protein